MKRRKRDKGVAIPPVYNEDAVQYSQYYLCIMRILCSIRNTTCV